MARLARFFPKARFIHIIRDGRAVAASLLEVGWTYPNSDQVVSYCSDAPSAARYWALVVRQGHNQGIELGNRYLAVRYEDLVREPRSAMTQVLTFLEEPWSESVLHHERNPALKTPDHESSSVSVRQPISTASIDRWRQTLSAEQITAIQTVSGPLLKALGYPLVADPSQDSTAAGSLDGGDR